MASFLNTSMAGATSRFITFELGQRNEDKLKKIFSTALIIHFIIALVVAILAESVGLWFVNSRMNFPPNRMFAVNVLYQFTILSMVVSFTQVPYSAAIIAHEKMSIYAYLEILNVTLKLIIVYLLLIVNTDRLILYAGLILILSVLMALIYRFYCIRHFKECHFSWIIDKPIIKEMIKFAGLDIYGNMCVVVKNQAQPIILNIFYGVVANAGATIALTITGAVSGFTSSVLQAFKPQITKQYAVGRIDLTEYTARCAAQFTIAVYTIIAIPILLETRILLNLWLEEVPIYAVEFIRLIIVNSLLGIMINVTNTCIHATGNIKNISFINGSLYLLCPILSYIWMANGGVAESVYIADALIYTIVVIFGWYFIHKQMPLFNISRYIIYIARSLIVLFLSLGFSAFVMILIQNFIGEKIEKCVSFEIATLSLSIFISVIVGSGFTWLLAFSKQERIIVKQIIIYHINKIFLST